MSPDFLRWHGLFFCFNKNQLTPCCFLDTAFDQWRNFLTLLCLPSPNQVNLKSGVKDKDYNCRLFLKGVQWNHI